MYGNISKAVNLFILRGQVRDRVAHKIGQGEGPIHTNFREVADSHADIARTQLRPKLRDHGGRQFNPVHANTTSTQRQRDPTGTDTQFQGGTVSNKIGEEVHRRVNNGRLEQLRPFSLVRRSDPLIKVVRRHRPIVRRPQADRHPFDARPQLPPTIPKQRPDQHGTRRTNESRHSSPATPPSTDRTRRTNESWHPTEAPLLPLASGDKTHLGKSREARSKRATPNSEQAQPEPGQRTHPEAPTDQNTPADLRKPDAADPQVDPAQPWGVSLLCT